MQQSLSPKKYIETKARSLPVYKCLVNHDWKESKMASVVVMRRHVNGNITAGVYLVDLLCLGIKDTFYIFNSPEEEITERFKGFGMFKEADYKLAHNIVYAGHDFAMEFDIHPHKDFATTRFILEEDNDAIPLVDIAVGDKDGNPHLMVSESNRFPEALAKLKKNAGEGNYHYTIGMDMNEDDEDDFEVIEEEEDEDEYEDEEEEDEDELYLDDIPLGKLNLQNVQSVVLEDLMNMEKVMQRTEFEQILLRTEIFVYTFPDELEDLTDEEEEMWEEEWELLEDSAPFPTGVSEEDYEESEQVFTEIFDSLGFEVGSKNLEGISEKYEEKLKIAIEAYSSNPVIVSEVYETSTVLFMDDCREAAMVQADKLYDQYPSLQLSLALGSLIWEEKKDPRFEKIYREKDLRIALPGLDRYYTIEVLNFWLLRLWISLDENNLKDAIQYLYLIRRAETDLRFLLPVLVRLNLDLADYYETNVLHKKDDVEVDDDEEEDDNDETDETPGQGAGGKVVPF